MEQGNPSTRAYGPSGASSETHRVVRAAIKQLPAFSGIGGDIGAGSAGDQPHVFLADVGDGGTEALGDGPGGSGPGPAAVFGDGDVLALFFVLGVIAADSDAVAGIGESQGEDAGARAIVADGRGGHGPGPAAVLGVKHAGALGAAGAKPGFALSQKPQAGVAGGEGAFVGEGRRRELPLPMRAAITGGPNGELRSA